MSGLSCAIVEQLNITDPTNCRPLLQGKTHVLHQLRILSVIDSITMSAPTPG